MPVRQSISSRSILSPLERIFPGRRPIPGPLSGGSSPLGTLVELQLGGSWVNISPYVRYADRISITRGRTDEGREVERGTCKLTLDNTDGRFSPRNPTGAYFGLIGRNTPLRVSVPYLGGRAYRFYGEVSTWPVRWNTTGSDVNVPIEASGILRRLGQGATPLLSAPRRYIEAHNPVFYRHLEEGPLTPFSSTAAKKNFKYGTGDLAPWLPPSLQVIGISSADTGITFARSATPGSTEWSVDFMFQSDSDETFTFRVFVANDFSFAVKFIPSTNTIELFYTPNSTGVDQSLGTTSTSAPFDNQPHHVRFYTKQNGANVDLKVYIDGVLEVSDTKTSVTNDGIDKVWIFPYDGRDGSFLNVGHLAGWTTNAPNVAEAADAALGHSGEAAGRRIERLCGEEGIAFTPVGDLDDTLLLGPQFNDKLVDILREAANTDMGVLFEPRNLLGLGYRTRTSLYNQTPRLALDYTGSKFIAELEPVDDDQNTRNDITVKRREGESYRGTLETGALSVQAPPDGVGRYDEQVTVNPPSDIWLPNQASWRLRLGTVDEPRYPTVSGFLNDDEITEGLRLNILDTDIGDRITITNPPAWLPPDTISVIVQGTAETIDDFVYDLAFNTSPESPYQVGVYDEDDRYDTPGSELSLSISATATGFTVRTIGGQRWVTDAEDPDAFPFDINIEGERITVDGLSGTSPLGQSFSVTRSVNGAVMAHPAGADVSLWTPSYYAL